MRKTDVNMKELKKTLSANYLSSAQQKTRITQDQMAKKIIDFSYNGIEVMKKNCHKGSEKSQIDLKVKKKDFKSTAESPLNLEKFTLIKHKFAESKKSRARPQSSSYAVRGSKHGISRMTTQGSNSSSRFMGKNKSRESYIRHLAEHKDR